jgi:phosphoribosyl-ATP pyrophosphohydrolase
MKNRVVRLNESDLEKLVQKIIREEETEVSQTSQSKTDKISSSQGFKSLVSTLKSKSVEEQVEVVMAILNQMDLKGNFGAKFKQALKTLG